MQHVKFALLDKGIDEKLAAQVVKYLAEDIINVVLNADEETLKAQLVANLQEVDKAKAAMEANEEYSEANKTVKLFRSGLRETVTPYLVRNKLIMELLS